ncbi:ubiquitin fusion degradation protein UFD1-domain-containing protein [Mucor lusitanicus]|uniref:Ubiquitin fusion degradation protein 1 n=1 Tax=Mucor circinelloides f. lusitanicus TaxID=29924 RepID=A0A8H4B9N5_MUCCL|nr:ubiquitin fusion degradation protein UFD1-domain-containing protein [Mucor lusitanicus]
MFNNFDDDDAFGVPFFGGLRPNLGGGGGFVNPNRGFSETYRCFPTAMMQQGSTRENVNYGGKIILPQSALEKLSQLNISYPMLFRLTNNAERKHSHAGVLEFTAEEGRVYLPQWMMETLDKEPGSLIEVKNVTLPLGTLVKLQAQSTDFLDITDHRAVLEKALRNFSTLTVGDIVQISYNDKVYEIKVLEVKPHFEDHQGISVVETDLQVEFAAPVGYVEPSSQKKAQAAKSHMVIDAPKPVKTGFAAFGGGGQSLRGKNKGASANDSNTMETDTADENDDGPLNLPFGQLYFGFPVVPPPSEDDDKKAEENTFTGSGQTLRAKKK